MNHIIVTGDPADWGDVLLFAASHPRIKAIENNATVGEFTPVEFKAAARRMMTDPSAAVTDAWRPWRLGTCDAKPAVSLVNDWGTTRWLVPA